MAAAIALVELARRWRIAAPLAVDGTPEAIMVPATAVGMLLAAGALLLARSPPSAIARGAQHFLAAATAMLGLAVVGLYLAEWGGMAGTGTLIGGERWTAQRPGAATALGLSLVGASLLALGARRWHVRRWAGLGAAVTLVIALTGLVGHAYGASGLYGLDRWGGTAVSTGVALSAVAFGVLFADPTRGLAAMSGSNSAGGHLVRRLTPAALLAPLLLGWLALAAQERGIVGAAFGAALLVVSLAVLLVGLIVRQATVLHAVDAEREHLLAREREAGEQVTRILESITDAFFAVDRTWRFTYVNREAERLLQRSRDELVGRRLWDEFSEALGSTFEREYQRSMAEQTTVEFVEHYPPLGIWLAIRAYPSADGLSVFFHDVTARKHAEERLRESEARFRALAENASMAIFVIDEESKIEFANPAVERIFGYTSAEMLDRSIDMLMPQDQRPRHDAGLRRYLETRRRNIRWEGVELPGLTKDGRVVPLEISMGEFERGGRHYFTGIARDITERKQAEAAVRESEDRFRALANTIPQLAWMADATGWIFWYNERWHEYTGTTLEEMEGWGWRKVHHPEHAERVVARIRHAFETGERWEDTFPLRSKTGEYRWFLSRALPIRDAAGDVVRWFGTNTDITEQMEAAAERERLFEREREARAEAERGREALERVTESRTRLMRGFSHDVKNPLGAADGHAQLLEEGILGGLSDKQQHSVHRIRRSIHAALRLIDDLLELGRAEAGQIETECVETDVSQAAREVAADFTAQASAVGLEIDVQGADRLHAETDPTRVRQILANLLSNAVKYAPNGRATVTAEVLRNGDSPRPGTWIAVSVTDTGPGIPEDKRELIFQEFTRLDPDAQSGAGVGLAISRRIAQLLGGDLTLVSEVGRGSTFTLWLPPAAPS